MKSFLLVDARMMVLQSESLFLSNNYYWINNNKKSFLNPCQLPLPHIPQPRYISLELEGLLYVMGK